MIESYGDFAAELYGTGIISDPWLNGRERFSLTGHILSQDEATAYGTTAERVAYLHHELADLVWKNPELLDTYFGLTPYQKAMWLASEGRWHGIARVDLFPCTDGRIRACEMNSDTPSGEAEAVLVNQLLSSRHPDTTDPNLKLRQRFLEMLLAAHGSEPEVAAIVYPTDLPEDLSMIALYKEWLSASGCEVIFGSPYNLTFGSDSRVFLLDQRVDLLIRHYKTDWWGERETVWVDEPEYLDSEALSEQLIPLLEAEANSLITVVNPFGSVLTQNKLSLAFMWERKDVFTVKSQRWIERYIPETRSLLRVDIGNLPREEWVIKSVYGCEGDSVICGPFVSERDWRLMLEKVIPKHWIAQRFFHVQPDASGLLPNIGVYVVGGSAAGFYTRLSPKATDYCALTAPTYVSNSKPKSKGVPH